MAASRACGRSGSQATEPYGVEGQVVLGQECAHAAGPLLPG